MGLGIRGLMTQVIQVMVVVGVTVPLSGAVLVVVAIKMMTVVGLG